ncbi:MAG TPA: penicillin-binding protein activator LpoB, partial [Polyangiaceae bacterium]|nr:penicillin-binding protein activator LpoB [Polyangiaceae bacterium]
MPMLRTFAFLALAMTACGPKAVRGSETPGLDDQAMSTGLDKKDLEKLLSENMKALQKAPVIQRWSQEDRPTVA